MIRLRAMSGALALLALIPVVAAAQPRNPYADLFGRTPPRTGREYTSLEFRSEAGAQWGQTIEQDFIDAATVTPDGLSSGADAALTGRYVRDRVQALGQGRYSYQEFRADPPYGAPAFDGGARINVEATTRLSFDGGAHYTRSPFFNYVWLPVAQPDALAAPDRPSVLLMQNDTLEGNAGVTSNYTRRSSISLSAYVRETTFGEHHQQDFATRGALATWTRRLNRDFALRAGYGRDEMRQTIAGIEQLFVNERIELGVDFLRAISLSRRTSVTFGMETSAIRDNGRERHYRVNGNVELNKSFARSWLLQVGARRTTEFLPGFTAPVFTERGNVALAGYLASRVALNINADGGQGEAGFNDPRKFISFTGSSKLTFGLTRHFGLFTQYVYYLSQNPPDPQTPLLYPEVARHAFSVGVQAWISLIEKEKVTTRDSR